MQIYLQWYDMMEMKTVVFLLKFCFVACFRRTHWMFPSVWITYNGSLMWWTIRWLTWISHKAWWTDWPIQQARH